MVVSELVSSGCKVVEGKFLQSLLGELAYIHVEPSSTIDFSSLPALFALNKLLGTISFTGVCIFCYWAVVSRLLKTWGMF